MNSLIKYNLDIGVLYEEFRSYLLRSVVPRHNALHEWDRRGLQIRLGAYLFCSGKVVYATRANKAKNMYINILFNNFVRLGYIYVEDTTDFNWSWNLT